MTLVLCIVMIATVPVGNVSNETIRSAHNLASSLACDTDRQRPFELSATVNFAALGSDRLVALEDMSGHVTAFDRRENGPDLSAGDVIRCSGAIIGHVRGQHAIITNIQRISRQPPKSPVLTTIGELRSGRLDHQTVRLNGKIFDIRASETSPAWMLLTIAKDGMSINASLASEAPLPASREDLIGSDVTITGVCLPRELGPRKHLGRVIKAYGLSSAVISRKAPDNWHDFPDLARLNTMSADKIPPFKRHKAAGMVLAVWNDQALIETANSIPVRISFVSSKSPAVGQFIEVIGHPETDLFNLILSHAIWREIAKTSYQPSDESKEPIEIAEVSNVLRRQEEYHGRTVSITGRVINMPNFNLNCGPLEIFYNNCIISIYVDPRWEIVSSLKIGSLVSVKGSCIVEAEHWHPYLVYPKALGFFIITRTPSDIRIISHPPWWTVGRLFAVIGTLLAALCASAIGAAHVCGVTFAAEATALEAELGITVRKPELPSLPAAEDKKDGAALQARMRAMLTTGVAEELGYMLLCPLGRREIMLGDFTLYAET